MARPSRIIVGEPGAVWTNDTDKILWQFHCSFKNSCALCIQFAGQIGPYWPIPLHFGCNCIQASVRPGARADPFVDFMKEVRDLEPSEQARVMGASNWRLVDRGVVRWEDVVTRARIRDFREVVAEQRLSVKDLVRAGVTRYQARKAHDAVHTAAHIAAEEARKTIVKALRGHGVSDGEIAQRAAELMGDRFSFRKQPDLPLLIPARPKPVPQTPPKPMPPPKPTPDQVRAENIRKAVDYAKARGVEVVPDAHADIARAKGQKARFIAAEYAYKYDRAFINEKHPYWDDQAGYMARANASGWFSSDSADHIIAHEVGHALHRRAVGVARYIVLRERTFKAPVAAMIREKVSAYASKAPVEFVAEVYAGLEAGKVYDREVMGLYRTLGGHVP